MTAFPEGVRAFPGRTASPAGRQSAGSRPGSSCPRCLRRCLSALRPARGPARRRRGSPARSCCRWGSRSSWCWRGRARAPDATASLATPLVVAAALAGRRGRAPAAVERAPSSAGPREPRSPSSPSTRRRSCSAARPRFAGYGILGDTAVHFVLIDRIMDAGTGSGGLAPSSYEETLARRTSPADIRSERTRRSAPCGRWPGSTWHGASSPSWPSSAAMLALTLTSLVAGPVKLPLEARGHRRARRAAGARLLLCAPGQRQGARDPVADPAPGRARAAARGCRASGACRQAA